MFHKKLDELTTKVTKERSKNQNLLDRFDSLQGENSSLVNKLVNTHSKLTNTQDDLVSSLNEITKQRFVNFQATEQLNEALGQIQILEGIMRQNNADQNNALTVHKLKENLHFKSEVVECLEKKLTVSRLKLAEQDVLIKELNGQLEDHNNEIKLIKEQKLDSVSDWQNELMERNRRVQLLVDEFDSVRNDLLKIKLDLVNHLSTEKGDDNKQPKVLFQKSENKKVIKKLKMEIEDSTTQVIKQQNEIDEFRSQIENLNDHLAHKLHILKTNTDERMKLTNIYNNLVKKQKETSKEVEKVQEKRRQLDEKFQNDLKNIHEKSIEHVEEIGNLEKHFQKLRETKTN